MDAVDNFQLKIEVENKKGVQFYSKRNVWSSIMDIDFDMIWQRTADNFNLKIEGENKKGVQFHNKRNVWSSFMDIIFETGSTIVQAKEQVVDSRSSQNRKKTAKTVEKSV